MRENAASKACRLLISGRVFVRIVNANEVIAAVRGDRGELYATGFIRFRWRCSCPAVGPCSRLLAVQRVALTPGGAIVIAEPERSTA